MNESCEINLQECHSVVSPIINKYLFDVILQQEAAAAAQNNSIENTSNLAANNQPPPQQPPNNVSSQPGAQSLPQNNQQQSMRPISSPNSSSSGSRSMSPAVGKFMSPFLIHIHELFTARKIVGTRWYTFAKLHGMGAKDKRLFFCSCLTPLLRSLKDFFSSFSFIV